MTIPSSNAENVGYTVPAEVYDLAVGWDPQPEVNRLLFLARQVGVEPHSALELGCATGRLLAVLKKSVPDVCGIELSATLAGFARDRGAGRIVVGDMASFELNRTFDLVFTSANTIRHVLSDTAITDMWRCIRGHLAPDGVFIADLELGFDAEAEKVGRPTSWEIARGHESIKATWVVMHPPSPQTRCCKTEYMFESRSESPPRKWRECFALRTYDAPEFLSIASAHGRLTPVGIYELRDPYLFETSAERALGRHLVVLRHARSS
jgi:SAM-dependent methyltransferase